MDSVTPNIWQLQSRVDIDGLTVALSHADPEVRRKAAAALRALDAAPAIPALKAALARETDWEAQATLLAAIQHLTHEDTLDVLIEQRNVEALVNLLFSDWTQDVLSAIEALGELGEKQASESLVVIFRSTELPDELRYSAAEALLRLQSAPAVVTLLAALRRDDWEVRFNAANMLGELHATWATRGLIDALDDEEPEVRTAARDALAKIGTPTALKALESADAAVPVVLDTLETVPVGDDESTAEERPGMDDPPLVDSPEAEAVPQLEAADPPVEAPAATGDDPYATAELTSLPADVPPPDPDRAPELVQTMLFSALDTADDPDGADVPPNGAPDAASDLDETLLDATLFDTPTLEEDASDAEAFADAASANEAFEDEDEVPVPDDSDDDADSASFYPVDVAF